MNNEPEPAPARLSPWAFVPLLYFMQAIPVTVVQEVSTVFFKDIGIANEPIARWTSLISLPWSLQLLLGPLVDLNGTKRRWILTGQFVIALGLIATAFALRVPFAFELALVILGATAVTSALCNIATDGFYIMSMAKDQQAKFVGVQTTCYRLGRLFCTGILVLAVGLLTRFPSVTVEATKGTKFVVDGGLTTDSLSLNIKNGLIQDALVGPVLGYPATEVDGSGEPEKLTAPTGVYGLRVGADGMVTAVRVTGLEPVGRLAVSDLEPPRPAEGLTPRDSPLGANPSTAWSLVLGACALIYLLGHLVNRVTVPRPAEDRPAAPSEEGETRKNLLRTLVLLSIGIGAYFLANAVVRLGAHGLWAYRDGDPEGPLKGWMLKSPSTILGFDLGLGGIGTEVFQLALCAVVVLFGVVSARRLIVGTPMGEAFVTFVQQPGFPAIFAFILFYRFGEAMVSKMTPLFLKDSLANGGLAVPNEQLGLIKGVAGVLGIVCGGLVGGYVVGKLGLRRAIWPLALAMHLPNLLYLWASYSRPPTAYLYGIDFVDQFGYGFGFAAYMVYIMWVAQRGRFKTSHYAIGTGMGALCIAVAGILSGVVQSNFGYTGLFWSVMFFSLPGLATLFFIPIDEAHRKPQNA